jgi:MFS transporter, MHS family, shikimate and dehydroshikimate transport protein
LIQIDETPEFLKLRENKKTVKMPVVEALPKYWRETVIAVGLTITEVAWVGVLTVFAVTLFDSAARHGVFRRSCGDHACGIDRGACHAALGLAFGCNRVPQHLPRGYRVRHPVGLPDFLAFRNPRCDHRDVGYRGRHLPSPGRHLCAAGELHARVVRHRRAVQGVSLGFQLGAAIGGGLTPVIAVAIVARTGATWAVSLILVALGILTVVAVLSTRETAARPMRS